MIFYLSATGNTRWAAEHLASATGEQLISISEAVNGSCDFSVNKDERIGFVFPVHGWRPPRLVREFIRKMNIHHLDNNFCYALCTAGDDIGQTMEILNCDLRQQHLKADSIYSLIMPESYVGLPFMDIDKPEKEIAKILKANELFNEYSREIVQRKRGICKTYKGHWPRINSWLLGTLFNRFLITDRPFFVDAGKCIRCGKCADSCITGNIIGGKGELPQWKGVGNCCTCFACYHHCPVRAIEYGSRTKNKGQYYFNKNKNNNLNK